MAAIAGWFGAAWKKSGLCLSMLVVLFKSALAPTIALCLLLSPRIAAYFGFVGYLTAIVAINPVLPQAQYVELMSQQVLAVCLACSICLLEIFSVAKAREHTAPQAPPLPPPGPGTAPPPTPYNSSASAVAAVWLVVQVFCVCYVRSARPALMLPCINYTVFVVVTSSVAPTFPILDVGIGFAKQLLVINLTGFAISIAVVMIIWPTTNRGAFQKDVVRWNKYVRECLQARATVLGNLLPLSERHTDENLSARLQGINDSEAIEADTVSPMHSLFSVVNEIQTNLSFAQKEISIGKLGTKDLLEMQILLEEVLYPVDGLMIHTESVRKRFSGKHLSYHLEILRTEHSRTMDGHEILYNALDHGLIRLGLQSLEDRSSLKTDIEAKGNHGLESVADMERRLRALEETRNIDVQAWNEDVGLPETIIDAESEQSLLFTVLEARDLLHAACQAALKFAKFADSKTDDGTMTKNRLILPSSSALFSWMRPASMSPDLMDISLRQERNPDHLQPRNAIESLGVRLRKTSNLLRSPHAGFGARIACAVLCSQILAYLHQTQRWYNTQRVVWTSITIALVTVRTAGQSAFGVLSQVLATLTGCLFNLLVWYIVDRKIPGVIVFYCLALMVLFYPAQRSPSLLGFTMVSAVTLTLLVGYELESERIGKVAIIANGQPYYPSYLLSWIDLLAILAGVGIASFWTLFPYPILESEELRRQLSDSVHMLAELHMRTHVAVYERVKTSSWDQNQEDRRKREYSAVQKIFIASLANLRQLHANSKYQIQMGGRFPREIYANTIDCVEAMFRSISLVFYATRAFGELDGEALSSQWTIELRRVMCPNEDIELRIVSVLLTCASALDRVQPLPPFIDVPETSSLLKAIEVSPMDLLSPRHVAETGYTALAAIHASALIVTEEIKHLSELTAQLVGHVEFATALSKGNSEEIERT